MLIIWRIGERPDDFDPYEVALAVAAAVAPCLPGGPAIEAEDADGKLNAVAMTSSDVSVSALPCCADGA